tara:strand:+ start:792 stop:1007 length:216 start_codon:yes stop_codon:yes gene_type:complete
MSVEYNPTIGNRAENIPVKVECEACKSVLAVLSWSIFPYDEAEGRQSMNDLTLTIEEAHEEVCCGYPAMYC